MQFSISWIFLFSVSLLAAFPGHGPGLQEHPQDFSGVVRDRLRHYSSSLKSKYFWYVGDFIRDFSSALIWTINMIHSGIEDEQDLNYRTEVLREQRLKKVTELVAIVLMSAVCLTIIHLTLRKNVLS